MLPADPHHPHALTLATAQGRRLCKLRRADGTVEDYDRAFHYDLATAAAPDLDSLAALLRDLAARRSTCILRGAIRDETRARCVRRLLRPDPLTGDAATLAEAARAWLALDLDSLPLPAGMQAADLHGCGEAARAALPAPFRRAACIVVAAAGHGFKPGARLRLWCMLARPLTGAELKRWLREVPVDRTVFGAAQPIYTAAPLFVGMADPLPHRLVILPGEDMVMPPPPACLAPPLRTPLTPVPRLGGGDGTARLAGLIYTVRSAADGRRHPTLYWAACRAGEMVAAGEVAPTAAARALAQAAMEGGGADHARALATAEDGILAGIAGGGR